ncbi:hypothetical protein [Mesobacterium pallidum]|uniref:hypothetical protein n=1 Tax=Mesobacterium pallidum TaxID=2872037 RepID=UPI001EE2D095|nr:hypothetical protein [Mesobacterium pallidum]
MKVLILETDPIVQIDLAYWVSDLGHDLMGPFGTEDSALRACSRSLPDAAIVDFMLGPERDSRDLAGLLLDNDVHLGLFSAHGRRHMPENLLTVPVIDKPGTPDSIRAFLDAAPGPD